MGSLGFSYTLSSELTLENYGYHSYPCNLGVCNCVDIGLMGYGMFIYSMKLFLEIKRLYPTLLFDY